MLDKKRYPVAGILLLSLFAIVPSIASQTPVKVWEEQVVIPTYLIGAPDPNPQFYFGGASQGAQQRIYPYPLYDNLTTEKANKAYTMVYLENEYIRIGILPELGGKIFEAVDKTNRYNFIYHQHVIKPALISLLGAWISGGVEWDLPHHHRASTFLPVQYKVDVNADGSKTVWVGELELRDRMRWAVGVTLHPGKSYLEASFRMVNRTSLPTSMLCFSNVAVSVNDTYQIIFPPSTQYVTFHTKNSFTTWPIATTKFAGTDFTAGVDVSWYKNHSNSTSMFAWNYQDDFFAGYDHGKNAGIMSIADHNVVPGKKFFTWGNSPAGHAEDTLLTDSDGPYIELMSGAYSDNQPDYSWLAPNETRSWIQYWYPFRDIDGVKKANIDAAVNLEVKDGKIHLGFYSTSAHSGAQVTLRLKNQVLLHRPVNISPAKSWVQDIPLPAGADERDLRATLSAGGRELVSYSPIHLEKEPTPSPVVAAYPPPEQVATNEELYFIGLRAEQFHSPTVAPRAYWEEALRRDPSDVRVNTAMGVDCLRAGRFADAEAYLRKALERSTKNYTTPKDEDAFYYLGLALKAEGKDDEALNQFSKSTWSAAWRSPGYLEMAQIATLHHDDDAAIRYVGSSLEANTENVRALALRASLLRRTNHTAEARDTVAALRAVDPLDVHVIAEQWLAGKAAADAKTLAITLNAFPSTALEIAADDMTAGLWSDGSAVLSLLADTAADRSKVTPLAWYYLGYFAQKMNQPEKAKEDFRIAARMPVDYVFPFQMDMIPVLEAAMAANPTDARAPYYLGNLLYDWQPSRAVELWQKSASLQADFPVVYRNLALVYTRKPIGPGSREKALAYLEKAASLGGNAMVLDDLDRLYEENGVSPERRLSLLEHHAPVVNRDDLIAREINLEIFNGHYDRAIALLKTRFFRAWEGGGRYSLGNSWINAHLLEGKQLASRGALKEALASYEAALVLPDNLQEATGNTDIRRAEISYWIGTAYEALGNGDKAQRAFRDASEPMAAPGTGEAVHGNSLKQPAHGIAAGVQVPLSALYYQARSFEKLGETDRAKALFQQLRDTGASQITNASATASAASDGFVPSDLRSRLGDAYYLAALGYLGLNNIDKARQELTEALRMSPDHLMAKAAIEAITQ